MKEEGTQMEADTIVTSEGYKENPDLLPLRPEQKTLGSLTFTLMMFSLNTAIPMFFLGPIGAQLGLSLSQALVGAFVGNLAAVVAIYLNGIPGVKYGISYPVQLREPFGFKGTQLPVVMRGISGIVWFGIEAYVGSLALMMIIFAAAGVSKDSITPMAIRYLIIALFFYLGSFVIVMRYGLKAIGKVANIAGPLMLLYFIWLVYFLWRSPEFEVNIPNLYKSTAGYFSLSFLIYLAVQTNWWATIAANISDLSRGINSKSPQALGIAVFFGVVICQVVGTGLGYTAATLTGVVLPQEIIVKFAPGALGVGLGLIFAFVGPWTTDLTANAPAAIDILMSIFKLRWKTAVIGAGVIAFFAAPWWAIESGPAIVQYVTNWASNYGILIGPFTGIMIGNYWWLRKQNYDLKKLYTYGSNGCWYAGGWSKAAYITLVLTWVACYIIAIPTGQMQYVSGFPFPGGVTWYFAVVISLICYPLLANRFNE